MHFPALFLIPVVCVGGCICIPRGVGHFWGCVGQPQQSSGTSSVTENLRRTGGEFDAPGWGPSRFCGPFQHSRQNLYWWILGDHPIQFPPFTDEKLRTKKGGDFPSVSSSWSWDWNLDPAHALCHTVCHEMAKVSPLDVVHIFCLLLQSPSRKVGLTVNL